MTQSLVPQTESALGLHEDISPARYHADNLRSQPTLSRGTAFTLINKSPLHAYAEHPRLGGWGNTSTKEPTAAMEFGDLCHQLMLGKGSGFEIWKGETWRGKEASAFRDHALARGVPAVKRGEHARALQAIREWRRQLGEIGLSHAFSQEQGKAEVVALWDEGGLTCRSMMDWYSLERAEIWDLKTMSESAHPRACASRIASMGYDLQDEWYTRGLWNCLPELTGRIKFNFLFAETQPPFAICPLQLAGEWRAIAVSKAVRARGIWRQCLATGHWPGYATEIIRAEPPPWALASEMGANMPTI